MSREMEWRGDEITDEIAARLRNALDEINLKIEGEAKAQLYPGHGKRTGTLQRSIHAEPAKREGNNKIQGSVGSNVVYARVIHDRYGYITAGLEAVKPQALDIVRKHCGD